MRFWYRSVVVGERGWGDSLKVLEKRSCNLAVARAPCLSHHPCTTDAPETNIIPIFSWSYGTYLMQGSVCRYQAAGVARRRFFDPPSQAWVAATATSCMARHDCAPSTRTRSTRQWQRETLLFSVTLLYVTASASSSHTLRHAAFLSSLPPRRPTSQVHGALPPGKEMMHVAENDGTTAETFSQLYGDRLPAWLLARVESLGYTRPTAVQKEALGAILEGEDVVVHSQTGTGKTLAFMLPLLAGIDVNKNAVQALVVVPSRELGLQVASVAKQLASGHMYYRGEDGQEEGRDAENEDPERREEGVGSESMTADASSVRAAKKILIMSLLEGSKNRRQKAWVLAEPPHVVIGNPHSLAQLVERGGISYHQVKMVVVDEVDACLTSPETGRELQGLLGKYLSPSFLTAELEEEATATGGSSKDEEGPLLPQGAMKDGGGEKGGRVARKLAPWRLVHRQTLFVSASIPQHKHFIKQCVQQQWTLREPMHVHVTPGELMPPGLRHGYLVAPTKADKPAALLAFLRRERAKGRLQACVIFTADDREAEKMAAILARSGGLAAGGQEPRGESSVVQALVGGEHITRRAKVMDAFRAGESWGLVTTDFAARGLDVPRVSHVIMLDVAGEADTYLHRGGRAGRMGRPGWVVSLVSETEAFALVRLANSLKIEVRRMGVMKRPRSR